MSHWNLSSYHSRGRPLVIGHRGTPIVVLENTRESFLRAMSGGADVVETDVHVTADGKAVCLHDDDLLRVAGVDVKIEKLTLAEAQTHFPALLLFSDFLDLTQNFPVIVDVKNATTADLDVFVPQVKAHGAIGRSLFSAYTPAIARLIKQRCADATIGTFFPEGGDCLEEAKQVGATWIRVLPKDYRPETIQGIHDQGFGTIAVAAPLSSFKTASDTKAFEHIAQLGIGSVITDTPELAAADFRKIAAAMDR
ncbi:glycerophosphodiester phosphodiesterase [Phyllobacterium sophorae]|uniref:GP-PDE domain-containing protein n=1 Tax=Phyllobacterium sophorae TaxID=1520277 RepID=A0A2P7B336_9HYPH|nr:glycerophosphodiester phosphodiesterase family protein [Phyllobacterium sophorae]PSH60866.1 hypothetical protein CU103_25205 [Phyllobacterium sophorae]